MPTLDEYRQQRKAPRDRSPELHALAREAVRAEAVTNDADWNHFLSYLEAAISRTTSLRDQEDKRLRDPLLVEDLEIRRCKVRIAELETRIATLKEVILLPKFIKEQGNLARQQIAELKASEGA